MSDSSSAPGRDTLLYGYGYFLAALISFCLGFLVAAYYVEDLPYQTFVRGGLVTR